MRNDLSNKPHIWTSFQQAPRWSALQHQKYRPLPMQSNAPERFDERMEFANWLMNNQLELHKVSIDKFCFNVWMDIRIKRWSFKRWKRCPDSGGPKGQDSYSVLGNKSIDQLCWVCHGVGRDIKLQQRTTILLLWQRPFACLLKLNSVISKTTLVKLSYYTKSTLAM